MAEMKDIRQGLVDNLATIPDCQKSPYRLANPSPPALLVIGFDEMTPTVFQRGGFSFVMLVQGLAGKATEKSAEIRLDEWLSPTGAKNVWEALESDPTLGGNVSDLAVLSCDGSQVITADNNTEYLGSTWHVQIEL